MNHPREPSHSSMERPFGIAVAAFRYPTDILVWNFAEGCVGSPFEPEGVLYF